jgi:hypothetical protein
MYGEIWNNIHRNMSIHEGTWKGTGRERKEREQAWKFI